MLDFPIPDPRWFPANLLQQYVCGYLDQDGQKRIVYRYPIVRTPAGEFRYLVIDWPAVQNSDGKILANFDCPFCDWKFNLKLLTQNYIMSIVLILARITDHFEHNHPGLFRYIPGSPAG
jgi:hypothetical protein